MHSKRIWSLKHDLTTSLGLNHIPIFLLSTPELHKCNTLGVDPYAHPATLCIDITWMWDALKVGLVLNHDLTTSPGLNPIPIFLQSNPDLHKCNTVGVDPMPMHSISRSCNTLYTYNMNVGYSPSRFGASSMNSHNHLGSTLFQFSYNPPLPCTSVTLWGWTQCPSTAYQGDKTLYIHITWMWDALQAGLVLSHDLTTSWAQPFSNFPTIYPWPAQA
jgi:hypothetical protein